MRRFWAVLGLLSFVSLLFAVHADDKTRAEERRGLLGHATRAVRLLTDLEGRVAAGDRAALASGLPPVLVELDALLKSDGFLSAAQQHALAQLRADLARRASLPKAADEPFAIEALRAPLDDAARALRPAGALNFQGSFTQPVMQEQAVGGHASAMGPPPMQVSSRQDMRNGERAPVEFVERPGLTEKTYWGSRSKEHILESGGGGIALFDFDGDGRLDVFTASGYEIDDKRQLVPHPSALYRNLGGFRFENVAAKAGVATPSWGQGACVGDFDDDGRLDLYVTNFGTNFLYHNNGDGTFTDVAAKAGVAGGGWSTGCAFVDVDGDGDLDLYVARYMTASEQDVLKAERSMKWRGGPTVMLGPVGLPGAADVFYENLGNGTFKEATDAHGLTDTAKAYGFGVVATDYDGDGWPDLFVANDSMPNFLYHNDGKGHFESVGLLAGVALNDEARAQAGMGVDAGDYDGDGRMDLLLTTFAHDTKTLYRNAGGGLFEDVSKSAGLAARTFMNMGWGGLFLDADNDGALDIFFANGHLYPQVDEFPDLGDTYRQRNQLLLNDGGQFKDVSDEAGSGLALERTARGLAAGDLDDDGNLDLVVGNMDDRPTLLQNRPHHANHWVGFSLRKRGRNRFAIGARVTLRAAGKTQVREIRSGNSFLSQSDLRAHFGLGTYTGNVEVEVRLGAAHWSWKALPIDRYQVLTLADEPRK